MIKVDEDLAKRIIQAFKDDELEFAHKGEWVNDYKDYDIKTDIVIFEGLFYSVYSSRCGSYYNEYSFDEPEVGSEVVPKEVVTMQWVPIE